MSDWAVTIVGAAALAIAWLALLIARKNLRKTRDRLVRMERSLIEISMAPLPANRMAAYSDLVDRIETEAAADKAVLKSGVVLKNGDTLSVTSRFTVGDPPVLWSELPALPPGVGAEEVRQRYAGYAASGGDPRQLLVMGENGDCVYLPAPKEEAQPVAAQKPAAFLAGGQRKIELEE